MESLLSAFIEYLPYGLQGIFCFVVLWAWRSIKGIFVSHEDCRKCRDELEERMIKIETSQTTTEKRVSEVVKQLENLPSTAAVHNLALELKEIAGHSAKLERAVDRLEHLVSLFVEASVNPK